MTVFSPKWKPERTEKKRVQASGALLPGEELWYLGPCNNMRPLMSEFALTSLRLIGLQGRDIAFDARYSEIATITPDRRKDTVQVARHDGTSIVFKMVGTADQAAIAHYVHWGQNTTPPEHVLAAAEIAREAQGSVDRRAEEARESSWPDTIVAGKLSRRASEAILRQCHGAEAPWFILTSSGGAGTLVAFEDRAVIIKTGGLTGFMAGSLGGERSASFHFSDITGIEYNSGFVTGVLEVLTASYNGTANRDYWRGTAQSRNADSNDPWTLSNCLPLSKAEYTEYLPLLTELKARISASKKVIVRIEAAEVAAIPAAPAIPAAVPSAPPASAITDFADLAEQLHTFAALRDSGVLTEEEFLQIKTRLIAGMGE